MATVPIIDLAQGARAFNGHDASDIQVEFVMPFDSAVGAGLVVFVMAVFALSLAWADWSSNSLPAKKQQRTER